MRKRRVVRYAILYFFLLILFVVLIAGPIVAGRQKSIQDAINKNLGQGGKGIADMYLAQPIGYANNDTNASQTGTGAVGGDAAATSGGAKLRYF